MSDVPVRSPRPILGWLLVVLGALFLADNLLPAFQTWVGPILFGVGGLLLLALYAAQPERRWLILAGGSLLSLAAVTVWDLGSDVGGGSVLFVGLAATFAAFALAPPRDAHRQLGLWAAAGCLVVAILAVGISWAWPLLLIGLGAFLLLQQRRTPSAPASPN